jgi:hypothetical protein
MGSCQLLQLPPEQQLQPLIIEPEALPVFSLDAVSYRVTRSVGTTDAGDTIYVSEAAAATAAPAVGLLSLDHESSQFQVKGFCFDSDPDPSWIRVNSNPWIRISLLGVRIRNQEGRNGG